MIRLTQILLASLLLLALNSQSDQQVSDDSFLLQILPALISATRHKQPLNIDQPKVPLPSVTITASEIAPFQYQFDALLSPLQQGITAYTWVFGDGRKAQGISSQHHYDRAGEYSVQLEISTASGLKYYAQKRIEVRAENSLPISSFSVSSSNGHAPLMIQFDASASVDDDGEISTYHWAFGDGSVASGKQVTHVYHSLGVYTRYAATLTVTDDRRGQHKSTQYVIVNQADTIPVANFEMSVAEGTAPVIVKFDASESTDLDGDIVDYKWDFGDGSHAEGLRTRHTYVEGGQFNPTLTVTDNSGHTHSFSQPLTITPQNLNPRAGFNASPSPSPNSIVFDAGSSHDEDGLIVTYHWDFGDGQSASGERVTHVFANVGVYTVTLFVTDQKGGVGITQQSRTIPGVPGPLEGLSIVSTSGETTDNPYRLNGITTPGTEVNVYFDGVFYQSVNADDQGNWLLALPLQDGLNTITAETMKNESVERATRLLNYRNQLSRDLSGMVVDKVLVLTPGIPPLPYVVDAVDLEIVESGKLVLQAGVEIQFNATEWPGRGLLVKGGLEIFGKANNQVHLTNDALDETGRAATWSGIRVLPEAGSVLIKHAVIDQAFKAIVSIESPVTIENTLISDSLVELIAVPAGSAIRNSQMGGLNGGISIYGNSSVSLQGNTFESDMNPIRIDCYASGCPIVNISGNNLLMDTPIYLHDDYVRLRGHQPMDVRGNWWGSTNIHQIGDRLLDTRGFLDGPISHGRRFNGEIFDQWGVPAGLEHNLTLQAGNAYFAYSDISVPSGVRLTLEAGAILRLDGRYSQLFDLLIKGELVLEEGAKIESDGFNTIKVEGRLSVNGSEQRPVVFTSSQDTPGQEDWAGIQITSEAEMVHIDHAQIRHASKGVSFIDSSAELSNSELQDNKYGIWIKGDSSPVITGNTITENETGIIAYENELSQWPRAQIRRNNLQGNQQHAVYLGWRQVAENTCVMRENWWGSTRIEEISAQIFDGYDTSNHPYLDFSDYLEAAAPEGEIYEDGVRIISAVYEDTRIEADEHIVVIDDIYVAEGVTLTLGAGSKLLMPKTSTRSFDVLVDGALILEADSAIEFAGSGQQIQVNGVMVAQGTEDKPVTLSSSGPDQTKHDWQGIHVMPSSSQLVLDHVEIRNAQRGIWFDGVSGSVNNASFEQNQLAIFGSGLADPDLQANTFHNNDFNVWILGESIDQTNQAPIALFDTARESGDTSKTVNFNALTSSDDGQIVAYHWVFSDGYQSAGAQVSHAFSEQDVQSVKLTVLDNQGAIGQIIKSVRYSMVNTAPTANAGADQSVAKDTQVHLDASNSYDDRGIVTYHWTQISGPGVVLSAPDSLNTTFTMPWLDSAQYLLFQLKVTDAQTLISLDTLKITLQEDNLMPSANAGADRSAEAGVEVVLDGARSFDSDGVIVTYQWVQRNGPVVELLTPNTAVARFIMPGLSGSQSLGFELSVIDDGGRIALDQLVISRPKGVILSANVVSGTAPLDVSFQLDSKIPFTWFNMDYDGDSSIDISQATPGRLSFRYPSPGTYRPHIAIMDELGVWHSDQLTIVVSDVVQEKAVIKARWDAMVLALLAGNIEVAMDYFSGDRREEFAYMFAAMGGDTLQEIYGGLEDIQLDQVRGSYTEIGVLRREGGKRYVYPVSMIKDENGVWKILKM